MSQSEQYWVSGYELSRPVMLSNIHIFLGPSASVRPYTYHGRDGYLVTGSRLTQEQIEDLKNMSKKFEREQSMKSLHMATDSSESTETQDAYISKLIPVNARGRDYGRDRERERERPRERDHYTSDRAFDRNPNSRRYW
ncbi:hypothetical protein FQN57_000390 [Myotisia sp. PD_48]|nr:hypothetical protein FQN57_000390 [Myotisia sp. PD_48]